MRVRADLSAGGVSACAVGDLCHRLRHAWRWLMWTPTQKIDRLDTIHVVFDMYLLIASALCASDLFVFPGPMREQAMATGRTRASLAPCGRKRPRQPHMCLHCLCCIRQSDDSRVKRIGAGIFGHICPFCETAPGTANHVFLEVSCH